MPKRNRLITSTIVSAGFVLSFSGLLFAEEKSGTETVELTYVFAVSNPGSRAPDKDAACKEKHGSRLGSKVISKYDINTTSLKMTAESNLFSVPVQLHPMGIQGVYAFMSDGVGAKLEQEGVERVIFSVSAEFDNPDSDIMMGLDENYNCILSNKAPF
jgi:hypothetical protein